MTGSFLTLSKYGAPSVGIFRDGQMDTHVQMDSVEHQLEIKTETDERQL